MFLIKLLRKLGKLIRGGVQPRQIVLGALLGVIIGMIPGFNLTLVVGILLLLLLNAHVGIALMGMALGKIGMFLLAPITFRLGYFTIHNMGLDPAFQWLANAPVTALLDLHVYCLIGGIPIAIVVGLIFSWVMVRIVQALQKGIIEATSRSERMQKLAENKVVKIFMRIVFGKQKETIEEMMAAQQPLFRKAGIILTAAVIVVIAICQFFLLDYLFASGLKSGLEMANGAEVNVASADLSLLGGRAEIQGLQVTDPVEPSHNSMQVQRLAADVSVSDLLRKRYTIDLLALSTVRFNERRESPGQVYEPPPEEPPVEEKEKTIYHYLDNAQTLRDYLTKLQDYLERRKNREQPEEQRKQKRKSRLFETAQNQGYLDLSARSVLTDQPLWTIRKIEVEGIRIPGLDSPQHLAGKNVSSHPELLASPMAFRMAPGPNESPTGVVAFNFHQPEAMNYLKLDLKGVSLQKGTGLSKNVPVTIEDGKANLTVEGRFSADRINFPFAIDLTQLKAQSREGESVLGMDSAAAQRVFENISTMKLIGAVKGSFTSPRLQLDLNKTLKSLKSGLGNAAKEKLIESGRKELEKRAGDSLSRYLDGDDKDEKEEDKKDEKKKEDTVDKLKQMF